MVMPFLKRDLAFEEGIVFFTSVLYGSACKIARRWVRSDDSWSVLAGSYVGGLRGEIGLTGMEAG